VRNLIRALRGKPVELSPKQQDKLAKAQARADAQIAAAEAAGRKAQEDYAAFAAAQGLPVEQQAAPPTSLREIVERAKDSVGELFDDRRDVLDPGPGADFNRPPAEIEDADERAAVAAAERAQRDAARTPYRAEHVAPVAFSRVAAIGRTQLEAVAGALQAADPAGVFGVYRLPDRFDHKRAKEAEAYVEWEIVHAPGALTAAPGPVATSAISRAAHFVQRAPGDPSVLDEDVMGAALGDLAPEDCFGLTRLLAYRANDFDDHRSWDAHIEGAVLLSRTGIGDAFARDAPHATLAPSPFHLEILDWEAIAAWVAPWRWGPPRTPSPLPHLPSTPQELLTAYLEVVGIRSADCYGVQLTRVSEGSVADLSIASFRKNFDRPKLPCADGEPRQRIQATEQVVLAYRDRPEYVAGRERWTAYQRDVLRARLDHDTGVRPPIEVDDRPRQSFASEVFDFVNPLDVFSTFPQLFNRNARPSLGPYCGELPER